MTVDQIANLLAAESSTVIDARNGLAFPRIDLGEVTNALVSTSGAAPEVTITSPADASVIAAQTQAVLLEAIATDAEDGDLSGAIVWSSNLQGTLQSPTTLIAGTHTLTASAIDSDLLQGTATVVLDAVNTPQVDILEPEANVVIVQGSVLNLSGSATDVEDGSLSNNIEWESSIDGTLGQGSTIDASLSPGIHLLVALVTDSAGYTPVPVPHVVGGRAGRHRR